MRLFDKRIFFVVCLVIIGDHAKASMTAQRTNSVDVILFRHLYMCAPRVNRPSQHSRSSSILELQSITQNRNKTQLRLLD